MGEKRENVARIRPVLWEKPGYMRRIVLPVPWWEEYHPVYMPPVPLW